MQNHLLVLLLSLIRLTLSYFVCSAIYRSYGNCLYLWYQDTTTLMIQENYSIGNQLEVYLNKDWRTI